MKLSDKIGRTPLLKISEKLYAKVELLNPTGSIKDRPASYIINDAEERGLLKKGDTLIEATSGNMGVSFAWLAAERGYKCVIIMPSNMSEERKSTLKFYGAELIEVPEGEFETAINLRDTLSEENGWFNCNQFNSEKNIESHRDGTAVELLHQCRNLCIEPSALITGTGTGGTIMGVGPMLKMYYHNMDIVAVEPEESPVMSGGEPGIHGIQGIGDGSKFLVDLTVVDKIITISTEDAKNRARQLAKEHGLFVGISAGSNILAAERYIKEYNPEGPLLTFLCDRGDRYFSCL